MEPGRAANHKSFIDAFFLALGTRRHLRYMAKTELFEGPLGALFLRLGAFPVRRGEADGAAMETARVILRRGGLVAVFPEGTRVEELDALASPTTGPADWRSTPARRSSQPRSAGQLTCGSGRSRSRDGSRSRSFPPLRQRSWDLARKLCRS